LDGCAAKQADTKAFDTVVLMAIGSIIGLVAMINVMRG
jgi:hypothetical protein